MCTLPVDAVSGACVGTHEVVYVVVIDGTGALVVVVEGPGVTAGVRGLGSIADKFDVKGVRADTAIAGVGGADVKEAVVVGNDVEGTGLEGAGVGGVAAEGTSV